MHRTIAMDDVGDAVDERAALRRALAEPTPRVPPVFGYDARGSALFEEITRLPTYYPTRVEWDLLRRHADDVAARTGAGTVVELGSGSGKKTRVLLAACAALRPTAYVPVDVSDTMLRRSADALADAMPDVSVTALWGRYEQALAHLRRHRSRIVGGSDGRDGAAPLAVAFLGANVGNATTAERRALLTDVAAALRPGDAFLVSVDLRKPADVLERAYNDPDGHSAFARFRLNHLDHLNRRFGADFDPSAYRPAAHWDEAGGAVEGHLWAGREQRARIPATGTQLVVRRGESINVGFSAKFDEDAVAAETAAAGMPVEHVWRDPEWRYALVLARRT